MGLDIISEHLKQLDENYIELQKSFLEIGKEAKDLPCEEKQKIIDAMALANKESIDLIAQCRQVLALERIANSLEKMSSQKSLKSSPKAKSLGAGG